MNKGWLALFLIMYSFTISAQEITSVTVQSSNSAERFPVFSDCRNLQFKALESCFYNQVQDFVFANFEVPDRLKQNDFQGNVKVLFEVDSNGTFKVIYIDATEEELIQETKRVFGKFPKIQPATYNGKPTYAKFTMALAIPLKSREVVV
ncbi:MAG: energy transducer TonB, partial [Methylotenera sp.]|nr:energy transducer TonB [Flavobacterium sp.]